MPKGGARNRSGPPADPASLRSADRGLVLTALPSGGYKNRAPAFPLPKINRFRLEFYEGGGKAKVPDTKASTAFRKRELEVWREVWKTPQACAWSREPWRWPVVAEFCRLKTVVEMEPEANAALVAQLHRFRDQVGLTPAGLKENGWAIAHDETAAKRTAKTAAPARRPSARDRLRVVDGDGG